jgi:tryptophan-rich sensory protein
MAGWLIYINKPYHIRFYLQLRLFLIIMLMQQRYLPVVFTIARTLICVNATILLTGCFDRYPI